MYTSETRCLSLLQTSEAGLGEWYASRGSSEQGEVKVRDGTKNRRGKEEKMPMASLLYTCIAQTVTALTSRRYRLCCLDRKRHLSSPILIIKQTRRTSSRLATSAIRRPRAREGQGCKVQGPRSKQSRKSRCWLQKSQNKVVISG